MKSLDSRKQFLSGASTAAGSIIFLAILVAIQYIVLQHPVRWDLTKTGKFTLSSQSKKVLETLKEKKLSVDALAFYETKSVSARDAVKDLMDQYRDLYPDFTYSFIDPDRDRAIAKANKIESYPTIVLKVGDREERITTADEETVTNAVMKLLRDDAKKVYFLKGHGERSPDSSEANGFKVAQEQIVKQNYKTAESVLMQEGSVPADAKILVVAGPQTDLMDTELEAIQQYLKKGGSLLVLLDPFKAPKLCDFLTQYGFRTADDIVVDRMSKAFGGDYLMPIITTYIDSPITKNFTLASFFPEARSVTVPEKQGAGLDSQELALTSEVSWTINKEQLDSGKATFDPKTGKKGPISVMAVSTRVESDALPKDSQVPETNPAEQPAPDAVNAPEKKPQKARIVVCGSSLFAANKFFKLQGNGDLFMNTVSWLAEDENLIAIRPKSTHSQPMVLTERDSAIVFFVSVVLLPFSWVLAGLAVYLYRRRVVAA
jgi:ABC-type uncharacterized transport system involved in gliding motility auxiliary subunit